MKLFAGLTNPLTFQPSSVLAFSARVLETPMLDGAKALQPAIDRSDRLIPRNFILMMVYWFVLCVTRRVNQML